MTQLKKLDHSWYKKRDKEREYRKEYDTLPVKKARRAHKADAKRKETLYLERTQNPRTVTTSQMREEAQGKEER